MASDSYNFVTLVRLFIYKPLSVAFQKCILCIYLFSRLLLIRILGSRNLIGILFINWLVFFSRETIKLYNTYKDFAIKFYLIC